MTTNKIVFWASDYSDKSGEGKLALLFVNRLKKYNKNNKTKLIKSIFTKTNKKGNKIFFSSWIHKYLGSIYGAGNLWYYYFRGYKTCYLNYLPLWNFLIFLFLPPNSILGPITGSISRSNSFFFKKILERISVLIIKLRYKKVIFSNNFYKKIFKKSLHNFIMSNFSARNSEYKKKYDFVFYIRNEYFKKNIFFYNLIVSLLNLNFKIATIGDKIKLGNIKNFGYSDKKTVNKIISLSKCAVGNKENLYSFFIQDCLKYNLTVFYNKEFAKYELFKLNNFYPIDLTSQKKALKEILQKAEIKNKKNHFKKINFDSHFESLI